MNVRIHIVKKCTILKHNDLPQYCVNFHSEQSLRIFIIDGNNVDFVRVIPASITCSNGWPLIELLMAKQDSGGMYIATWVSGVMQGLYPFINNSPSVASSALSVIADDFFFPNFNFIVLKR
jgi:hypothetical protein